MSRGNFHRKQTNKNPNLLSLINFPYFLKNVCPTCVNSLKSHYNTPICSIHKSTSGKLEQHSQLWHSRPAWHCTSHSHSLYPVPGGGQYTSHVLTSVSSTEVGTARGWLFPHMGCQPQLSVPNSQIPLACPQLWAVVPVRRRDGSLN